jgi:GNAT superfamily N-acetyltransferase
MLDLNEILIAKASEIDAVTLTDIAFAAKRCWNYPELYYELWKNELTITSDYINRNMVYNAICQGSIIGFFSLVEVKSDFYDGKVLVKKGFWLDHIFVNPGFHKMGIGRKLIDHVKQVSKKSGISNLLIFVDPFAKGFYDKIGADYLCDSKSSIEGRMIPVYRLNVS